MGWTVEQASGSAASLHADPPPLGARLVRVSSVSAPALVIGSAQRFGPAEGARAVDLGLEVVRRRSGGGAVLLSPGAQLWVDVVLPRGDVMWADDVSRSGLWLGEAWLQALGSVGVSGAAVHEGPMVRSALSDAVCFVGLGPGEVTIGGAKVVGVSQRRTREGALFQCSLPIRWDAGALVTVFAFDGDDARTVLRAGVGVRELAPDIAAPAVLSALVAALPEG